MTPPTTTPKEAAPPPVRIQPDIEVLPGPPPPFTTVGPFGDEAPTVPPTAPPPTRSRRTPRLALLLLMALAFAGSLATSTWLFPKYSLNHDEPMYVVESRLLLHGHVTLPASQADFFRPWAAGVRHGHIVLKYAPPWPAVIAASTWLFGSSRFAPALVAAALVGAVFLLGEELFPGRRVGLIAAALFALSPVVVVQGGTYLPYLFQLLAEVLFAYLVLSGLRRRSWVRLLGAGAAIGVATFARPFDAVLIGLPFLVLVLWTHRRHLARAGRDLLLIGAGSLPFVAAMLAYDEVTMGSPLTLPFTVTGRFDTLGFGRRGVFPDHTFHFGVGQAVQSLENLWAMPGWTFGGLVLVGLAVVGLARSGSAGARRGALAAVAATVAVGYFFFWSPFTIARSWPGLASLGPFYHLPVLVPLVVFAAVTLDDLVTRRNGRVLLATALVAMVGLTAWAVPPRLARNRATTRDLQATARVVAATGSTRAVVFLPEGGDNGFSSPTPFLVNQPDLTGTALYATDHGPRDLDLLATRPGRTAFVLHNQIEPGGDIFAPALVLTRLDVRRAAARVEHLRITNPGFAGCVTTYATSGSHTRSLVLDRSSGPGRAYDVAWTVAAPASAAATRAQAITPAFAPGSDTSEVALGVSFGRTCSTPTAERYERRFEVRRPDAAGTTLEIAEPGRGWHRVSLSGHPPFWVPERVDDVIDLRPPA